MAEKKRTQRVPLGQRDRLTAPKKKGFRRRFVNDDGDRVQRYEAAGYNLVKDDIQVGDHKIGKDTQMGRVVRPSVGGGTKAVLMEIKEEFYQEDQKAKQDKVTADEQAMKQQLNSGRDGTYGNVKIG